MKRRIPKLKIKALTLILLTSLIITAMISCNTSQKAPDTSETESDIDVMRPETDTKANETASESDSSDSESTEDDLENAFVYVALGDSIAYGYGLIDFDNERYSALIDDKISDSRNYTSLNYAVNGDDSTDLINLIKSGGVPELKHADLITVSIGANNVLGSSLAKLSEYYLYETSVTDENLKKIRIPQIYNEMMQQNADGTARFATDIVTITELIKSEAPDAQIIFQTIYNPYRKLDLTFDFIENTLDLAQETDRLVTSLNSIIVSNAKKLGYDVADVYSAFNALDNVVNADSFSGNISDFATSIFEADPHPNKLGHQVIAETILPIIKLN